MATEIKYNGETIATVNGGETATMNTANKKMTGDVEVVVEEVTQSAEAIIDVDELPQAEIEEVYTLYNGEKNSINDLPVIVHTVETLPPEGEVYIDLFNPVQWIFYYQTSDNIVYVTGLNNGEKFWEKLSNVTDLALTWQIISSEDKATLENTLYFIPKRNPENINTQAFYRVPANGAYTVINGEKGSLTEGGISVTTTVYVVDTLPEAGEPVMDNFDAPTKMTVYVLTSDNLAYVYIPAGLMGDTAQWAEASLMFQDTYGGVISSEAEATDPTKMYIVYDKSGETPILYHYKNGWHDVGGASESGGSSSGGMSIKQITFTDRPSLWAWLQTNYTKAIKATTTMSGTQPSTFNLFYPLYSDFGLDGVAMCFVAAASELDCISFSINSVDFYPTRTHLGINAYLRFSSDNQISAQPNSQDLPDEYWSVLGVSVTITYIE